MENSSIVVVAFNEQKHINDCLTSLIEQTQKPGEIILVDDGSTDKTVEIASKLPVKIIRSKHLGRYKVRNVGWRSAKGSLICFAEADAVFDKNWLKEILKEFKKGADAVIDKKKVFEPKNFFQKSFEANFTLRYLNYVPFSAWAFKKKVLREANGFDENLNYAGDKDLGIRIREKGFKIYWAEKAIQFQKGYPKSFFEFASNAFAAGIDKGKNYYRKNPKKFPAKKIIFLFVLTIFFILSFFQIQFIFILFALAMAAFTTAVLKAAVIEKGFGNVKMRHILGIAMMKIANSIFYPAGAMLGRMS